MSIAIRNGLGAPKPYRELKDEWEVKTATLMEITERFANTEAPGSLWESYLTASAAVDAAWKAVSDRHHALIGFMPVTSDLTRIYGDNDMTPDEQYEALDLLYRAPQVHEYDHVITEEEFAHLFDGVEEREADNEAHDALAELVEPLPTPVGWDLEHPATLAHAIESDAQASFEKDAD